MKTIALVAHDKKKHDMVEWVGRRLVLLRNHAFFATGTTGGQLLEAYPMLKLTRLKSGPLGGDQQIGALIAEDRIDLMIFFTDPLSAQPHDVDVKALTRLATLYNVPFACNPATADLLITSPLFSEPRRPREDN
jgi:methylglyoxal synthase